MHGITSLYLLFTELADYVNIYIPEKANEDSYIVDGILVDGFGSEPMVLNNLWVFCACVCVCRVCVYVGVCWCVCMCVCVTYTTRSTQPRSLNLRTSSVLSMHLQNSNYS